MHGDGAGLYQLHKLWLVRRLGERGAGGAQQAWCAGGLSLYHAAAPARAADSMSGAYMHTALAASPTGGLQRHALREPETVPGGVSVSWRRPLSRAFTRIAGSQWQS